MPRRALAGLLALGAASACTETLKDTYAVDIVGPRDAFTGATVVKMLVSGQVSATANISNGSAPFTLEAPDLDPNSTRTTFFAIRAEDDAGGLVAFGQTPQLEVLHLSPRIRIFVQQPGTLVRGRDLVTKTRSHVAVPAESTGVGGLTVTVTVPVFGAGYTWVRLTSGQEREILSNELFVYNPLTHAQQELGAMNGGLRAEAAAITRADRIYLFGGLSQTDITKPPQLSSQLDVMAVGREVFSSFFLASIPSLDGLEGSHRKRTVLATTPRRDVATDPVFAFGGLDAAEMPLDSIVMLDVSSTQQVPVSLVTKSKLSAPRVGHTANTVATSETMGNILIYGGAPAGGTVADLFDPMAQTMLAFDVSTDGGGNGPPAPPGQPGHPGTGRRHHVALSVNVGGENRILVLGGLADDGSPRDDSLFYVPARRRFEPGPIKLKVARSSFVAFVINDDLVVAGGQGAGNALLDSAEVYDTKSWTLIKEMPAVPRAGATATSLPNLSVVVLGGATKEASGDSASNAVEIYQPRK